MPSMKWCCDLFVGRWKVSFVFQPQSHGRIGGADVQDESGLLIAREFFCADASRSVFQGSVRLTCSKGSPKFKIRPCPIATFL